MGEIYHLKPILRQPQWDNFYGTGHIHVKRDRLVVKFWLEPVELAKNFGFADHEVTQVERLVRQHREFLIEAWHEYFDA